MNDPQPEGHMASHIGRRKFLATLGGAAAAWPLAARAQQARKVARIGVLWHAGSAAEEAVFLKPLVEGIAKFGYVEGQSVIFEHRFPAQQPERFKVMAAELPPLALAALLTPPPAP